MQRHRRHAIERNTKDFGNYAVHASDRVLTAIRGIVDQGSHFCTMCTDIIRVQYSECFRVVLDLAWAGEVLGQTQVSVVGRVASHSQGL